MTQTVTGSFDVTLTPLDIEGEGLGRRHIDKRFHGPLEGTSQGQMLSAGTATTGSAVYVAVERVEATLNGRRGAFVLHHTGVMDRGAPTLAIAVCPDSGTDELRGLRGVMTIEIVDRKHLYTFTYDLPA